MSNARCLVFLDPLGKTGGQKIGGLTIFLNLDPKKSWDLPDKEASTIGGFIINLSKRIPLYGEIINYESFKFKILSHSRKKIIRLKIEKTNQ